MQRVMMLLLSVCVLVCVLGSGCNRKDTAERSSSDEDGLQIDPATGIPYALTFQFPVVGFDTSDFGFGFASENNRFCLQYSGNQCVSYGYHLGRDTVVGETPFGTEVVAPGDGIVRVTTDLTFHFVEHMDEVLKIALIKPLKIEKRVSHAAPRVLTA